MVSVSQHWGLNPDCPVKNNSPCTQSDPAASVWVIIPCEPKCKLTQMCGLDLKAIHCIEHRHKRIFIFFISLHFHFLWKFFSIENFCCDYRNPIKLDNKPMETFHFYSKKVLWMRSHSLKIRYLHFIDHTENIHFLYIFSVFYKRAFCTELISHNLKEY